MKFITFTLSTTISTMNSNQRRAIVSHPGAILKEEFLKPLHISVYALSGAIGVPRTRMNDIVLGRRGISADTALRLAKFFGTDAQSWLNLQQRYDLILAQTAPDNTLRQVRTLQDLTNGSLP